LGLDVSAIADSLAAGNAWQVSSAFAFAADAELKSIACALARRVEESGGAASTVVDLVDLDLPATSLDLRDTLCRREALQFVAAHLAIVSVGEDWDEFLPAVRLLAESRSHRVHEALVLLVARMASASFKSSRAFWAECLLEDSPHLPGLVLRGLALSDAPPLLVLELFSTVISDLRKVIRHNLGPRAIPDLARRDPRAVYARLKEWADMPDEITRWNVAHALQTPLAGLYVESAMDIIDGLAADERPSIWRAAAEALVNVAQRRPAFVLPTLARWRTDPRRSKAAQLALTTLARR